MSRSSRDVVLLGAGGLARETIEAVRAMNETTPVLRLRGLLDDDPRLHGAVRGGLPVLGPLDLVHDDEAVAVVVCVASPDDPGRRARVVERLGLAPERYATVVHPRACLAASTVLGEGAVVLSGVVSTCDVRIGAHVVLMPQVVLTHDDDIGRAATLGAGACLAGGVEVGPTAYLGSGCQVRQGVRLGAGAVLGMGAVLLHDVPAGQTWVGVPARQLPGRAA